MVLKAQPERLSPVPTRPNLTSPSDRAQPISGDGSEVASLAAPDPLLPHSSPSALGSEAVDSKGIRQRYADGSSIARTSHGLLR